MAAREGSRMTATPKAWIDETTKAVMFRSDVTKEEAREVRAMLSQAYDAGLRSGYEQGRKKVAA